jgi:hypothetical protein
MRVHTPAQSSAVERIGYDEDEHCLSVWFRGGRRYIYSDVPRALYDEFRRAASAGRFVTERIKGRYPCRSEPQRRRYPLN